MGAKQILVVDDEPIDKLPGMSFDLVITDLTMPGMTGAVLAKEIKERHPALPIIMVTAYPPSVRSADVDTVLLKPFAASDLQTAVIALIGPAQTS